MYMNRRSPRLCVKSIRQHTSCALVTGVQTGALPLANAEHRAAIWGGAFEIRRGRDVRTLADRVVVIICNVERDPARIAQRHDHARDQAVAAPADRAFLAVDRDPADEGALPGGAAFLIIDQHEAILVAGQIGALEKLPDE